MSDGYPDRYVITGLVKEGDRAGERVWIYFSEEGGGWWQWGPEGWAYRFEDKTSERFQDAMRCAKGETWTESTVGPWYNAADIATVEAVAVPANVTVS